MHQISAQTKVLNMNSKKLTTNKETLLAAIDTSSIDSLLLTILKLIKSEYERDELYTLISERLLHVDSGICYFIKGIIVMLDREGYLTEKSPVSIHRRFNATMDKLHYLFKSTYITWPKYSGQETYPIYDTEDELDAKGQFHGYNNLWELGSNQLALRLELIDYCIDKLSASSASN